MRLSSPLLLTALAGGLVLADLAWWRLGGFAVSPAYAGSALLGLLLALAAVFYHTRRGEPRLAAMLGGAGFLMVFSAAASLFNSFALTIAGKNSDAFFDRLDRALGFHWYDVMLAMAAHPLLNRIFFIAYNLVLPEIALLLVALAIWGRVDSVYRFCARLALAALVTIAIWAIAPAFGAMALYTLPTEASAQLMLSMTGETGRAQIALLAAGPGRIAPDVLHSSLIGFPSYHCALALLVVWHARELKPLRWPLIVLNAIVIVSTPIQGGHHLMDVLGALPVTALVLWLTRDGEKTAKSAGLVNKRPNLTIEPVPSALFRAVAAQSGAHAHNAIKPTLSGLP